jgi:chromosome segregation ATPase
MTTQNISLVIMSAAQLAEISSQLQQLAWRAAGYDRLKATCQQQKGRIAALENRVASADEITRRYWTMIQNGSAEVRQLQQELEQVRSMGATRETVRLRFAANILDGRVTLQEQQLVAADKRIKELEAALVLKGLPAGSLDNVLQMAKAA